MKMPSRFEIWYGRDARPRVMRELQAGPVTVQLDECDLRYVRSGGLELARRIYAAVRDPNWGTVPAVLTNLEVDCAADHFTVRFDARHQQCDIDYMWRGTITGPPGGTITEPLGGGAGGDFPCKQNM